MQAVPIIGRDVMPLAIRQIHHVFVGEVSGVDLTKPLTKDDVAALEAGMDRYAVLVFRDQRWSDDQQMAFTLSFGPIEERAGGTIVKPSEYRLKPGMVDVSNLDKDGKPLERTSRTRFFNLGNQLWHSDSSFRPTPAKYSILSGRVVADKGGQTEFADTRITYDLLDEETRAMVDPLVCEHSLMYSRATLGFTELTDEERAMFKPVRQRLVRTHPRSGRKSLFLSSHIGTIVGWPMPEARAFIRDLTELATRRDLVYAHTWRPFDVVMWDNRTTLHRVRRFDETKPRDMRRTTVAGEGPTVEQAVAA